MRKLLKSFLYGLYLFFLFGLIFHTSTNPIILEKYSLHYIVFILLAIGFFWLYRKAIIFVFSETTINRRNGKLLTISPLHKILFYIVIFSVCFLVSETILRIKEHEKNENAINGFHPFLQNKLNINDTKLNINSYGFRGDQINKSKPDKTYRIFFLGGSTVLCDRVPFEKSHSRILEKLLQQHYQEQIKIEVLNAGNHWHTSEHSIIKYLFKIKDFDPDLIILWHSINDLYRSFTPVRLAYGKFQSDYSHFLGPVSDIVLKHFEKNSRLWPTITMNSLLLNRFFTLFEGRLYSDLRKAIRYNKLKPVDVFEFPSLKSFERNLNSLVQLIQNDQVKLILATQPFLYHENLSKAEKQSIWFPKQFCVNENNEYPNLRSMELGMNHFNSETKKIAETHHIPLVDLEAHVPKDKNYFLDDCHYTQKGNQLVAEIIFEFIMKKKIIE